MSRQGWMGLALLTVCSATGWAGEADPTAGQELWRSCAACHCVPDARIVEDEDWLKLNETTTCIAGERDKPGARASLIRYLRAKKTIRPLLIDEAHPIGGKGGELLLPSTAGSAYLKADRASVRKGAPPKIRLRWNASAKGTSLALPAGNYRVISYSFYCRDKEGRWVMSGSSAQGCLELAIDSKRPATFGLLPEIRAHLGCKPEADGYLLWFYMTNRNKLRLSLARDGALVDPKWIIRGPQQKVVDRGDFAVT